MHKKQAHVQAALDAVWELESDELTQEAVNSIANLHRVGISPLLRYVSNKETEASPMGRPEHIPDVFEERLAEEIKISEEEGQAFG